MRLGLYVFWVFLTPLALPLDFAEVVRAHHRRAEAILLADTAAGATVQRAYVAAIGANRNLVTLDAPALRAHKPRPCWAMGVLVDERSDLEPLALWAKKAARDAEERIRFYLLPKAKPVAAFAPWYAAGFDDPRTADARDWRALHPSFGLFFANIVYVDAKMHPERLR